VKGQEVVLVSELQAGWYRFEIKRFRDPGHHRRWRVTNTKSGVLVKW